MSILGTLIAKLRGTRPTAPPPVIHSVHGDTTEWCRLQAARNMKADAGLRQAVEDLLIAEMGDMEAGRAEARRRYPEAGWED